MYLIEGRCYVGRHVNGREYVILRFAGITGVGRILGFDGEEFRGTGRSLVIDAIQGNPRVSGPNPTLPELLKLKRKHTFARVHLHGIRPQKFEMTPLHSAHGWRFSEWPGEIRSLGANVTNRYFMKILDEVLDVAS